MRVPQVSERIKEAPALALRGVFAGIGQLLLVTDKLRNKAPQDVPRARAPQRVADATVTTPERKAPAVAPAPAAPAPAAPAGPAAVKPAAAVKPPTAVKPAKPQSTRDFDKTGNVRLLGEKDGGSAPAATAASSSPGPGSSVTDAAPPLPNYGELSIASLRARLRNLDVAQVRRLADYERAHAARADVVGMFERRIAKLEAES